MVVVGNEPAAEMGSEAEGPGSRRLSKDSHRPAPGRMQLNLVNRIADPALHNRFERDVESNARKMFSEP